MLSFLAFVFILVHHFHVNFIWVRRVESRHIIVLFGQILALETIPLCLFSNYFNLRRKKFKWVDSLLVKFWIFMMGLIFFFLLTLLFTGMVCHLCPQTTYLWQLSMAQEQELKSYTSLYSSTSHQRKRRPRLLAFSPSWWQCSLLLFWCHCLLCMAMPENSSVASLLPYFPSSCMVHPSQLW